MAKKSEDRLAAAILNQIQGAGAKDMADYNKKMWDDNNFKKALDDMIKNKDERAAGSGWQYVQELRKRFIREGKDKQLEVLNNLNAVIMAGSKKTDKGERRTAGGIIIPPGGQFELENEEEEEKEEKKT